MSVVRDLFAPIPGAPPAGNIDVDGEFWLVVCTEAMWNQERRTTNLTRGYKFVHDTESEATKEARRLALKFQDYGFAVVKAVAIAKWDRKRRRLVWDECRPEAGLRDPLQGVSSFHKPGINP
jgi:hypothetical protein